MATVHAFVHCCNAGGTEKALASCTDAKSILDEFPLHEGHDAGALS